MRDRILQIVIILIPVLLFCWLIVVDICPSGIKEVELEMDQISPYINRILPDGRVSEIKYKDQDSYLTIEDEPTYFTINVPNTNFNQIEVELEYNNYNQPVIELGGLVDIYAESYDLESIQNSIIDELDWTRIQDQGIALLQKSVKYTSIDEFLNDLPDQDQIATYHYDLETPYRISNYYSSSQIRDVNVSLRGYHKYLTYIKNENFYLEVDYMDMNRTAGPDDSAIRVRNENDEIMFEYFIYDDGNELENQIDSDGTAIINQPDWPEGVYSVELSGTSDMFWRSLSTTQKYMTFVSKIYIADDVGYLSEPKATEFYTNAKHITFETDHSEGIQYIKIGTKIVELDQTHQKVTHTVEDTAVVHGYSPVGDVKIVGDGKFSFSSDMFFDPDPVQLNAYSDIDTLGVDYILTSYIEPQECEDLPVGETSWTCSSAIFDLRSITQSDNAAKFTISTPGLSEFESSIDIHKIKLRFIKDPLSFTEFISAVRELIPFGI